MTDPILSELRPETAERVVLQLYRLFKVALIHDLKNDAMVQAIAFSVGTFRDVLTELRDPAGTLTVLFTAETVFINGQILKASRGTYEATLELTELLLKTGFNQVFISPGFTERDIHRTLAAFVAHTKSQETDIQAHSKYFTLQSVDTTFQIDEADDDFSVDEQLSKTFAYAVVTMRQLTDGIKEGNYRVSRLVKRLVQRLINLAGEDPQAFIGLSSLRLDRNDESKMAVNAAILAVAVARLLRTNNAVLFRVAMAAMLYDSGVPRAVGMGKPDPDRITKAIPRLNLEQKLRVPASTALVLTALGGLRDEAVYRTIIGFEAQWVNHAPEMGILYQNELTPAIESLIVATVWRLTRLLAYDVWSEKTVAIEEAIDTVKREASSDLGRMVADVLVAALGIFPRGSLVELSSGWSGVVLRTPEFPGLFRLPTVLLLMTPDGEQCRPTEVDLADAKKSGDQSYGQIKRIDAEPDERLATARDHLLSIKGN